MEEGIKVMAEQHLLSCLGARHLEVVFGHEFIQSPRQVYYLYLPHENTRWPTKVKECAQGHRPANSWSQDLTLSSVLFQQEQFSTYYVPSQALHPGSKCSSVASANRCLSGDFLATSEASLRFTVGSTYSIIQAWQSAPRGPGPQHFTWLLSNP